MNASDAAPPTEDILFEDQSRTVDVQAAARIVCHPRRGDDPLEAARHGVDDVHARAIAKMEYARHAV